MLEKEYEALKSQAEALVGSSGWGDQLQLGKVVFNENGSFTFRFVSDDFNEEDDE